MALDRSAVGTAPAGQEVAILVRGSHHLARCGPDELASMSKRAYPAYVEGLLVVLSKRSSDPGCVFSMTRWSEEAQATDTL